MQLQLPENRSAPERGGPASRLDVPQRPELRAASVLLQREDDDGVLVLDAEHGPPQRQGPGDERSEVRGVDLDLVGVLADGLGSKRSLPHSVYLPVLPDGLDQLPPRNV